MNWQIVATLIAALSFVATGFALSWRFGGAFAELRMRDDELKAGLGDLKLTAASLSTALAVLPDVLRRLVHLEDTTLRNTSDIRGLTEKVAHTRGRLDSQHDIDTGDSE